MLRNTSGFDTLLALAHVCLTDLHVSLVMILVFDLAHMFDATQAHHLREMLTFLSVHTCRMLVCPRVCVCKDHKLKNLSCNYTGDLLHHQQNLRWHVCRSAHRLD